MGDFRYRTDYSLASTITTGAGWGVDNRSPFETFLGGQSYVVAAGNDLLHSSSSSNGHRRVSPVPSNTSRRRIRRPRIRTRNRARTRVLGVHVSPDMQTEPRTRTQIRRTGQCAVPPHQTGRTAERVDSENSRREDRHRGIPSGNGTSRRAPRQELGALPSREVTASEVPLWP